MDKRTFLKRSLLLSTAAPSFLRNLARWTDDIGHLSPGEAAQNEDFWMRVRSGYRLKPDYINLENGYYCFLPQEILESYIHHLRDVNYQGSWYMRKARTGNKAAVTARLAEMTGCNADELAITRNTTESLDIIIGGFSWQAGDEAIVAEQDYFSMLEMFEQQARQHSIVVRRVSVPNLPAGDEEIVDLYARAITPRTRLLMVSHMVNITGQILPIRKICDMAHSKGVEVMVDGAHAIGHFRFAIRDLHCDYYGSSLHKWLSVPLGAGLLYVSKDKISKIRPLIASAVKDDSDINRLNHTGTYPAATDLAVGNAIDYYDALGPARKEARLRYLQQYWTEQARQLPHVQVNTPNDAQRACGIANAGIKGIKPSEMAETLLQQYRIWTVAIDGAGVHGCRIAPNVYTTTKELDVLVKALREMS